MKRVVCIISLIGLFVSSITAQSIKGLRVDQSFFPYELIDSITYSVDNFNLDVQNIWYNSNKLSHTLLDNSMVAQDEISSTVHWFEIDSLSSSEMRQVFISTQGYMGMSYINQYGNCDYCFSKISTPENLIFLCYNSDNLLSLVLSENCLTTIDYTPNGEISLLTIDDNHSFVNDTLQSSLSNTAHLSSPRFQKSYTDNLNIRNEILDHLRNERPNETDFWSKLGDLGSFLVSNILPTVGGGLYGKLVDSSLESLRNAQKDYLEKMLNILYGNCSIEITDISHLEYNYNATIKVSGVETLPKNRYSNKSLGVYYGIVGEIDTNPDYVNYDLKQGPFFTITNIEEVINLGSLKIDTHYFTRPYIISYNQIKYNHISDNIRYGTTQDFTTPCPNGTAEELLENSLTETSASIKCFFSNITSGVNCGIIVESEDFDIQLVQANNSNGEQIVQLSNLSPGTTYKCFAYVEYNGQMHSSTNPIIFTTYIPSIAGTWNCVETYSTRPFPGAPWEEKTKTYILILNEDGTIQNQGADMEYIAGSWSYSAKGEFNATGHLIATQTQNTWDRFYGQVDDIKNPQKIVGSRLRGNMNHVTNVENYAGSIVMTK